MKAYSEGNRCEGNRFFITRRKINPVRLRLSATCQQLELAMERRVFFGSHFQCFGNTGPKIKRICSPTLYVDVSAFMCARFFSIAFVHGTSTSYAVCSIEMHSLSLYAMNFSMRTRDGQIARIRAHFPFAEIPPSKMYFINGSPLPNNKFVP